MAASGSPLWLVVIGCAMFCQLFKTILYAVAPRKIPLFMLFQSSGLPDLASATSTCLLVVVVCHCGWQSAESGFALVFAVIGFHDSIKMGGAAVEQQRALYLVLDRMEISGTLSKRAVQYLDPRSHHPAHMLVGAGLGALFALAFGVGSG